MLTEPEMTFVVKSIFQSRATSYFDPNIKSVNVLPSICDTLCKYNLFIYFETWFHNSIFPCHEESKSIVYREVCNSEMKNGLSTVSHTLTCIWQNLEQILFLHNSFGHALDQYPDLVRHLDAQVRLVGNLRLNSGVPWLSDTDGRKCSIFKNGVEDAGHFFLDSWSNLKTTFFNANPLESSFMFSFFD